MKESLTFGGTRKQSRSLAASWKCLMNTLTTASTVCLLPQAHRWTPAAGQQQRMILCKYHRAIIYQQQIALQEYKARLAARYTPLVNDAAIDDLVALTLGQLQTSH